jgi:protein TonB
MMMKKQNKEKFAFIKYVSAFVLPVAMVFAMAACNSKTEEIEVVETLPEMSEIKNITVNPDKSVTFELKSGEVRTMKVPVTDNSVKGMKIVEIGNPNQIIKTKLENGNQVFVRAENMPSFPGGLKAMYKYLGANTKYPEQAQKDNVQGRVFIGFVVEKDGSIGNIKVLRPVNTFLDVEAIRVIKSMPKWTPGTQGGQKIRVSYTVPVNFALK